MDAPIVESSQKFEFFNISTYNMGCFKDYFDVLNRIGQTTLDKDTQLEYEMAKRVQWNIGTKTAPTPQPSPAQKTLASIRINKLKEVLKTLINSSEITLLQEVRKEDFSFIQSILTEDQNYVIAEDQSAMDAMIIWNNKKFIKIEPTTTITDLRRAAVVLLAERTTRKIIQVASVHFAGFNVTNPQQRKGLNKKALKGDADVLKMLSKLYDDELQVDMTIVGGDFNSEYNPQYYAKQKNKSTAKLQYDLSQRRFKILEEQGFERVENNLPTCFNAQIQRYEERKNGLVCLDHLFIRVDKAENNVMCLHNDDCLYPLENTALNPSDHRPLVFTLFQYPLTKAQLLKK